MEKSLFRFIWRNSAKYQIIILLITCLSYPVNYILLDLPKQITNEAIQGSDFPVIIFGIEFDQIDYLVFLCMMFLVLVVISNGIKLVLNVYKGRLGERMLRRLRFDLYQRVLRFRLPHFKKVSSGEIIPMITAEVEDVGGYIGEAIALPAYQGGMLIVQLGFIFMQDPLLGLAAVASYPVQGYIIPKLQKKVVMLSRERVRNVRTISDRVGETISGISEIHANDASAWHSADLSDRLYKNFTIRFDIYNRKYFIKFLNNFMNQLTPFFFYLIGGYLAIAGNLSLGALLAVIAAYKDLAGPWKELLAYYQQTADVQVKYQTVVENFDPPDIYPVERITSDDSVDLEGDMKLESLSFSGGAAGQDVQGVSLDIADGSRVVFVGPDGSGRAEILQMACGLLSPTSGRVLIGDHNLDHLCEATLGRQISYVGSLVHVWTGTIRDNLMYGLRHRPLIPFNYEGEAKKARDRWVYEAEMTANPLDDTMADWDDLKAAGVESEAELEERLLEVIELVGLSKDLYRLGLQSILEPENDELMDRVLSAREALAEKIQSDPKLRSLVELWNPEAYNNSASLAENLFFAVPSDHKLTTDKIPEDPEVKDFLEKSGMDNGLAMVGLRIAKTMVELLASVKGDIDFLGNNSIMTMDELPDYEEIVRRCENADKIKQLEDEDRSALIALAFRLVPTRHRLGIMDDDLRAKVIEARKQFREFADTGDGRFIFFDPHHYIPSLTIEDNLLFGRVRLDRHDARQRIDEVIREHVYELKLRRPIRHSGLDYHVGVAGSRLSSTQRRRLCVARAILKNAKLTVFDETVSGLSEADIAMRATLFKALEGKTVLFGTANEAIASEFDSVVTLEHGRQVDAK
ncbi:ATP-binding cassette domain-containing protein [Rhodobacteraceae bacterium RKSG542]|uniref:ATP-binding cassette domain-containing protein n=1 Tax=Pseudovibrio flavus TaxID=2529854 RepID=UPI0012BB7828|nr:ATP-binding cassette domain-containing protein [Pseudovibrio flavus]MTI17023.1 ATP-binding cassette domain-containing protein [Pseudovibrio flavus]